MPKPGTIIEYRKPPVCGFCSDPEVVAVAFDMGCPACYARLTTLIQQQRVPAKFTIKETNAQM